MTTQTTSPIARHLQSFDTATWVLSALGVNNQNDRRRAINQALTNVSAMPERDFTWLVNHLKNAIAPELANQQPYETAMRLKLTAYAIIHYLHEQLHQEAVMHIRPIGSQELSRICDGGTID